MRPLFILLILLAFPVLEVTLLVALADRIGWWLLLYLLAAVAFGAMLIAQERLTGVARILQTVQQGKHPVRALLTSAKTMFAGLLFMLPGVISDIVAVILLLIRLPSSQRPAANDDVIEGEWRRED